MNLTQRLSRSRAGRQSWSFPTVQGAAGPCIHSPSSAWAWVIPDHKVQGNSVENKPNQPKPSGLGLKDPFQTIQFSWNHQEHKPEEKITSEGRRTHLWGGGGGHRVISDTKEHLSRILTEQKWSWAGKNNRTNMNLDFKRSWLLDVNPPSTIFSGAAALLVFWWGILGFHTAIHQFSPAQCGIAALPPPGECVPVLQHGIPAFSRLEKTFETISSNLCPVHAAPTEPSPCSSGIPLQLQFPVGFFFLGDLHFPPVQPLLCSLAGHTLRTNQGMKKVQ